ncbi:MAG TPA: 16S rRNA (guanine(527)-N(7))-methyltransferase RsmG [Xanthobacteraceae bacterium]|nr:16S rRNA (guanine(527)-N(7))-methyltransferase RsmG [Xanthobacteraceae bacterium]
MAPPDLAVDRAHALALVPVSRETAARLDRFAALLLDWQSRHNLIAASTASVLWTRHIADSLQLLGMAPQARKWVDLGSGAGFPGLPIACALTDQDSAEVHLIESNNKKAAFLREAIRVTGAPAIVHAERIADFSKRFHGEFDAVTARALAPLPELLSISYPLLKRGPLGMFPKGQDVDTELTEAAKCWSIEASLVPSRTDPKSRVVVIRRAEPKLRA